jgi:hypothetical protein
MANSNTVVTATLRGIRPILFDRYGGDNKTKLDNLDKGYRNEKGEYLIPVLNVFSMLSAQNTPSVAKRFYGKQGREVALGVQSFVNIEAAESDDPMFAPIRDKDGKIYTDKDKRVQVVAHVARLKDGIPNPKERPMIPSGWVVVFRFELQENNILNLATLKKMVEQGGILGLGTFRPIFGRFSVEWS